MKATEKPCRACANVARDDEWGTLPLVRSLSATDVAGFMTTLWAGRVIEVRTCPGCGRGIARMVLASSLDRGARRRRVGP
jgi:hypothetical protein